MPQLELFLLDTVERAIPRFKIERHKSRRFFCFMDGRRLLYFYIFRVNQLLAKLKTFIARCQSHISNQCVQWNLELFRINIQEDCLTEPKYFSLTTSLSLNWFQGKRFPIILSNIESATELTSFFPFTFVDSAGGLWLIVCLPSFR